MISTGGQDKQGGFGVVVPSGSESGQVCFVGHITYTGCIVTNSLPQSVIKLNYPPFRKTEAACYLWYQPYKAAGKSVEGMMNLFDLWYLWPVL